VNAALLDTNVLLAIAWPFHQHHAAAHRWFERHSARGWATCALTELGFIRLSSNRSFTANAVSPGEAAELLQRWTRHKHHHFWNSPSAVEPLIYARAFGPLQVNDAWLVETARRNKGVVATFDVRMEVHAGRDRVVELIEA
jgi:uncharacterized protein